VETIVTIRLKTGERCEVCEMTKLLRQFRQNESGANGIEYAILAAFISLTIISSVKLAGNETSTSFNNAAEGIRTAAP